MKDIFFDKIDTPSFLEKYFDKDDWYMMIGEFKEILKEHIKDNSGTIRNDTVKTYGVVQIGKNCTFGDYVVIEGPAYIGDEVEICPGAYIRPGSIIGNGCSIGHVAQIKNALMMNDSKIANHSFLGDSIMGSRARLGGHCETTNRRFDQKPIDLIIGEEKISTGLEKLGMILGEDSRLGGDVLPAPGTTVGKKTFIDTGLSFGGHIPPNSYVKKQNTYEIRENKFDGKLNSKFKFMT